jgi:hypothetical protein
MIFHRALTVRPSYASVYINAVRCTVLYRVEYFTKCPSQYIMLNEFRQSKYRLNIWGWGLGLEQMTFKLDTSCKGQSAPCTFCPMTYARYIYVITEDAYLPFSQ